MQAVRRYFPYPLIHLPHRLVVDLQVHLLCVFPTQFIPWKWQLKIGSILPRHAVQCLLRPLLGGRRVTGKDIGLGLGTDPKIQGKQFLHIVLQLRLLVLQLVHLHQVF